MRVQSHDSKTVTLVQIFDGAGFMTSGLKTDV
jgi:hypothetical protein